MEFTIFCDGGCSINRRDANCFGGYGYVILNPSGTVIHEGGGEGYDTTNNIMELVAVIKGLGALKEKLDKCYDGSLKHDCIVITDSKYVGENYTDYLPDWKKRGWRKANGRPVLNKEQWIEIDKLTPEFKSIRFQWVKGHAENRFNNRADALVHRFMRKGSHPTKIERK
jgi:ribonuclease HI